MSYTDYAEETRKYRFYNFSTPEDYDKGIDYDGVQIKNKKHKSRGLIKNPSGLPTNWQGYGLK